MTEGPFLGDPPAETPTPTADPATQKLMEDLAELDKNAPPTPPQPVPTPAVVSYNLKRAGIIEQIVARLSKTSPGETATWVKQLADNLSAADLHSPPDDHSALKRLQALRDQQAQTASGSNLAGYVAYRSLWTEYSPKLAGKDMAKAQGEWLEKLSGYVQTYPHAEDTASALQQLGMGSEFSGKEEEAKRWYKQLAVSFPESPLAKWGEGAAARLELVGKPMALTGQTAAGASFNLASLKGKVVAVYYWASYCSTLDDDLAKLKQMHAKLGAKGLEVVTVNLDDQQASAQASLQKTSIPGTHLLQPGADTGGLNGPLGTQYGIIGLPSLFLVGKDGKVISRTLHVSDLEEAIQKAL
jgi:thiol-disulfide isomerase/thioredoxin